MGRRPEDLTGRTFGNLTANEPLAPDIHGYMRWLCTCACGLQHVVRSTHLTTGVVTRCKNCQRTNANPGLVAQGFDIVAMYVGQGEHGGFAVVRDADGVVQALTNWSRKPHIITAARSELIVVRWAMNALLKARLIQPRHEKESWQRWMSAVRVRVEVRERMSWPVILREWRAAGGTLEKAHPLALPPPPPLIVPILTPPPEIEP